MKGLILSLLVFVLYVISTAIVSHLVRFERHSRLFLPAIAIWIPIYFAAYFLTPATLGFLSTPWMATHRMLDAIFGCAVLLLNIHSYIDFFFGFNGGFSTSIMLLLFRSGVEGATTEELIGAYRCPDGTDKIHGWRLPRLIETGWIRLDPATGGCNLTSKGLAVARLSGWLKGLLCLGKGG
jgi:hypothetical protein